MKRGATVSVAPHLWRLAIGYLFVAVNIEINDLGILLPTFVGYALIAMATWSLGERQRIFRHAAPLAAILAIVSFVRFMHCAVDVRAFTRLVLWPSCVLEVLVIVIVSIGLWREGLSRNATWLKAASLAAVPVLAGSLVAWWFIPVSNNTLKIASFLVYVIPAFCMSGISALAARTSK